MGSVTIENDPPFTSIDENNKFWSLKLKTQNPETLYTIDNLEKHKC